MLKPLRWLGLWGLFIGLGAEASTLVPLHDTHTLPEGTSWVQVDPRWRHHMTHADNLPYALVRTHKTTQDRAGTRHTRFQQHHHGVPVWGHHVLMHWPAGHLSQRTFTGHLVVGLENDLTHSFPDVIWSPNWAIKQLDGAGSQQLDTQATPVVYLDDQHKAHWAWRLETQRRGSDPQSWGHPVWILDAFALTRGQLVVLKQWDALSSYRTHSEIHHTFPHKITSMGPGGNEHTGFYMFGTDKLPSMHMRTDNTQCVLANHKVAVYTVRDDSTQEDTSPYVLPTPALVTLPCGSAWEGDDFVSLYQAYAPANDAFVFANVVSDMYRHHRVSVWEGPAVIYVHHGWEMDDAFWVGGVSVFGDGTPEVGMYPLSGALDVVAHEMSHGFTHMHAKLSPFDQPGAVSESFSDIASHAALHYFANTYQPYLGNLSVDQWDLGHAVCRPGLCTDHWDEQAQKHHLGIRFFEDPTWDGESIGDIRDWNDMVQRAYAEDSKGAQQRIVHRGAGVLNKFFYGLSQHPDWGVEKAFGLVLRANMHHWTPNTTYLEAAEGLIRAAARRDNIDAIVEQLFAVGIECSSTSSPQIRSYSCQVRVS